MQSRRHRNRARSLIVAAAVAVVSTLPCPGAARAGLGDCAQPVTSGAAPLASDCRFILRSAVGQFACPSLCTCDTNGSGTLTATDALLCLKKAVGQDIELLCGCTATTTSTSTTTLPGPCELLVNGDFELPVIASPQNGWSFENVAGGWKESDGNPDGYFELNAAGQLENDPTLSQIVTGLQVGSVYRVRGDYRSFAPGFGDPNKPDAFAVRVEPPPNGQSPIILALPRPSPDALAWTAFHADFMASADTVTISFLAERDGDDSSFDVDNLCIAQR